MSTSSGAATVWAARGSFLRRSPWVWAVAGSLLAWLLIGVVTQRFALGSLTINATAASFLAFVALGQMLVITGGGGGIDLSVPYIITLSAYWSSGVMNGSDSRLLTGVAVALGLGLAVGLANAAVIMGLGMPPIVGTLAVGFLADSAVNVYASHSSLGAPSPALAAFVRGSILGFPHLVLIAILLTAVVSFGVRRMVRGLQISAVGQSEQAARLSGVPVGYIRAGTFIMSGALAGFTGLVLAAYNNSAFLNMGSPYQLASIGAVVLGGSLIAGGRSTAVGTAAGALFLTLVLTLMQSSKLDIGIQNVGEGLLVISVLLLAGGGSARGVAARRTGRRARAGGSPELAPAAASDDPATSATSATE